ncbi:universal stress protein [Kitasatospora terrestris]|uniref:Universal stress protein n=1 Tax=Kitasatospora terrestris TaxID=258051 RepID=A0ABP9EPX6_9ACTN
MGAYVLAGLDGSVESTTAAGWAADQAVRRRLALRLVHVETWLDDAHAGASVPADVRTLTTRMLTRTQDALRAAHPGLEVRADLLGGGPVVDVLVDAATDPEAELLVLGSRGIGGFEGLVVGSVGLGVTARSPIPTALVRAHGAGHLPDPDGAPVVLGVDTRAPSAEVIEYAFREAARRGALLRAVHGWTPPPVWGYAGWVAPQAETEEFRLIEAELLSDALAGWREKFPEVAVVECSQLATGAQALVDQSSDAGVVVVGRRLRHLPLGPRLGPVGHAVLHHAHAPVLVVPHD